ncbi:MAG: hypothetical protein VKK62_05385 [Synechococcaceae cyanobacterium]|nr:hypothetical protein [Synechococcaceae cyanobacterium]
MACRLTVERDISRSGAPEPLAAGGELVPLPLLQPGSFVRLRDHPDDLPPFQLIQCRGGRCWVRQQAWGVLVQWEVARRRLTAAA